MTAACCSETIESLELLERECGREFERQEVVADFREDKLCVVLHAAELDIEAILGLFGFRPFAKERRTTAPAAQDDKSFRESLAVHHDHAATACTVDNVRAVEAGCGDMRVGAGWLTLKAAAEGVARVFDEDDVVLCCDGGELFQIRQVAEE